MNCRNYDGVKCFNRTLLSCVLKPCSLDYLQILHFPEINHFQHRKGAHAFYHNIRHIQFHWNDSSIGQMWHRAALNFRRANGKRKTGTILRQPLSHPCLTHHQTRQWFAKDAKVSGIPPRGFMHQGLFLVITMSACVCGEVLLEFSGFTLGNVNVLPCTGHIAKRWGSILP